MVKDPNISKQRFCCAEFLVGQILTTFFQDPKLLLKEERAHTATLYVQDGSINILTTWWFSNGMTTLKTSCSASNRWLPCTAAFLWSTHHQHHGSSDGVRVGVVGRIGLFENSDTKKKTLACLSSKDTLEIDIFPPRECCVYFKRSLDLILIWWFLNHRSPFRIFPDDSRSYPPSILYDQVDGINHMPTDNRFMFIKGTIHLHYTMFIYISIYFPES